MYNILINEKREPIKEISNWRDVGIFCLQNVLTKVDLNGLNHEDSNVKWKIYILGVKK